MRLRAPSLIGDDSRIAQVCCGGSGVVLSCIRGGPEPVCRVGVRNPAAARAEQRMRVGWYLRHRQRHLFYATRFRQSKAVAKMQRDSATKIGQGKGALPITAVGCADQIKKMYGDAILVSP